MSKILLRLCVRMLPSVHMYVCVPVYLHMHVCLCAYVRVPVYICTDVYAYAVKSLWVHYKHANGSEMTHDQKLFSCNGLEGTVKMSPERYVLLFRS